jgi:1-acyl-sn-glycerol-3-phosphate acyltransferase
MVQDVGRLYNAFRTVCGPVVRFLWRVHTRGGENVPASGPAILAPNHISFLDSPFLMLSVPRRITFVGKAEYMDDWKTKYLFPAVGMIPIDRGGELYRGHTGPARLAVRTGAPIIPVGIRGTSQIQPPDAPMPRPFQAAEVWFGIYWIVTQASRWNPTYRRTFKVQLSQRLDTHLLSVH